MLLTGSAISHDAVKRLTRAEALELFKSEDLLALGQKAHQFRMKLHPRPIVSFVMDTNINYTNICDVGCLFCAFYRPKDHHEAYVITKEELNSKLDIASKHGVTTVLLQGGMHPELKLDYYKELLSFIKIHYPDMHIHAFSPPEIIRIANVSGMDIKEVLSELKSAGLMSIPVEALRYLLKGLERL
jgi:Thiamine biosynthesis enzyme ThiH and related uncharacterized enzymes